MLPEGEALWEPVGRRKREAEGSRSVERVHAPPKATSLELANFVSPLFFFPRYWRRTLGMQVRYAYHEDYQFCYSFRGRPGPKPSILMLHGFSAHKDMWLSVVKVQF